MKELSYDQLILQIRKNNKEAYGLLFSLLENYMRHQANKNIYNLKFVDYTMEDFLLIGKEITIESLDLYEMDKALFFAYWKTIILRKYNDAKERCRKDNFYENNKVSLDENLLNYKYFDEGQILLDSQYDLNEQYAMSMEKIELVFGNKTSEILKMWCEGYSYEEIVRKTKVNYSKVNYEVSKAIKYLRNLKK